MEQKPIYDSTFISGVIVNDVNYSPVNEPPAADLPEQELFDMEMGGHSKETCACGDKTEEVTLSACDEFKEFVVHNVRLHCEGRILTVKVQLTDVCPDRKIRLAVLLFEKDCFEKELRGLRTAEIKTPCSLRGCVDDILVGDFCFVLPEEQICSRKEVLIKVIAHYSSFPKDCRPVV
jgi:hypothetical protein